MQLTDCNYLRVLFIFITLSIVNGQTRSDYKIPQPTAVVLSPRGFRITIPDERGIILFAFHGNINKDIQVNEIGDYNGQTRIKTNGMWTYENKAVQLKHSDVLNFWIYVQKGQFGYSLNNQRYVYPDHFIYNSEYTSTVGSSGLQVGINDDMVNYNSGSILPWDQQEYTTQKTRTTTSTSALVYEEPFVYTQPQSQPQYTEYSDYTTRPSRQTTRPSRSTSTTAVTTRETWTNYFGTTQRTQSQQNQKNQQRPTQSNRPSQNQNNLNQQHNQSQQRPSSNQRPQNQYQQNQQNQQQPYDQQQNQYIPEHNGNNPYNRNCNPSITTINRKKVNCKDTVIFEEQFNNGFLDRWSQDIRMPLEFEDAEFVLYHNYTSVWNVSNGNLNIYPKLLYQVHESGFSANDIRSGHLLIDTRECTSFLDPKQECERHAGLKRILPPVNYLSYLDAQPFPFVPQSVIDRLRLYFKVVSSKFRSKKTFNFKFGKVEIRAKVPKGDWLFPQIYLEPSDNKYRGTGDLAYLNGQVRIAFIRGNEILEKVDGVPLNGKILNGICVVSGGDTVREAARKSIHFGQEHFGNDFHTYSIIWTNSSIRFMVDGLEYGTDTGGYKQLKSIPNAIFWENGSNMAPFDQEFHVALGVGVGGNADFADDSRTGWNKTPKPWQNTSPKAELSFYMSVDEWYSTWNSRNSGLIVDYVKVYSV